MDLELLHEILDPRPDKPMAIESNRRPTQEVFFQVIDWDMDLFSDYQVESVWCDPTDSPKQFLEEICAKKENFQYMYCPVFIKQGRDYMNMRCLFFVNNQGIHGIDPFQDGISMGELDTSISNPLVLVIPTSLSWYPRERIVEEVKVRLRRIEWGFHLYYDIKARYGTLEDVFKAREGGEGVDWDYKVSDQGGTQILMEHRTTNCKLCDVLDDKTWDKLRRIYKTILNGDDILIPRFTINQLDDILARWK